MLSGKHPRVPEPQPRWWDEAVSPVDDDKFEDFIGTPEVAREEARRARRSYNDCQDSRPSLAFIESPPLNCVKEPEGSEQGSSVSSSLEEISIKGEEDEEVVVGSTWTWKEWMRQATFEVLLPLFIGVATVVIPLEDPKPGFVMDNFPYLLAYIPALSIITGMVQLRWYTYFTRIRVSFLWPVVLFGVATAVINVVPMAFGVFPIRFYTIANIRVLWLTVLPAFLASIGTRRTVDLLADKGFPVKEGDLWNRHMRFYGFMLAIATFQAFAFLYTLIFSTGNEPLQVAALVGFQCLFIGYRKIVLHLTHWEPLSLWWLEFTHKFFIFIVFPAVEDIRVFTFFFALDLLFGVLRSLRFLGMWWKLRCSTISFFKHRWTGENALEDTVEKKAAYLYYACYSVCFGFLARMLASILFIGVTVTLRYGTNARYYPYNGDILGFNTFWRAQGYACYAFLVNGVALCLIKLTIWKTHGLNVTAIGFKELRRDLKLILFDNVHALFFSLSLLLYHNQVWWALFSEFPQREAPLFT